LAPQIKTYPLVLVAKPILVTRTWFVPGVAILSHQSRNS
jgi:hypothetical protein